MMVNFIMKLYIECTKGDEKMDKINLNKDKKLCILVTAIFTLSYAFERLVEIFTEPTRVLSFSTAIIMAALVAVCGVLLYKSKNPFFGLLASLIGYKMMPPSIAMMTQKSVYGAEAYYIFTKLSAIMFVCLIARFYYMQKEDKKIRSLPLLALMLVIPFFSDISEHSLYFFLNKTGSMMGYYFSSFACYIIASLIILILAYKSGYHSMRFAAYFEFVALGINIMRKGAAIIATTIIMHNHISRSYYVWIAIYIGLIALFWLAKNKKKKELNA